MIRLVHGNMFDCQADALVNTVNCVGVMGGGVALQFKNRYPDMCKRPLLGVATDDQATIAKLDY